MTNNTRKFSIVTLAIVTVVVVIAAALSGCASDADVASRNLSLAADQFEINRRIIFYNGITNDIVLNVEGRCSLGNTDTDLRMSVTCKVGPHEYAKHVAGISDNMFFISSDLGTSDVSEYHHRVILKPEALLPNIDLVGSWED